MAKSPRDLAPTDSVVWYLEEAVAARFADFDNLSEPYIFPDLTTQVLLTLSLNQTEWTKLYTAVLTGADLSYPNQSHNVEYLFLQMLGNDMADICAVIADCILNSDATQSALREFLASEGLSGGAGDPNAPMSGGILGGNLLPAGYSCTDDASFGMALAVVDSIHEATEEVLQAIEILTNPLELAAELADNAPGIGLLAAGADAINWIQDTAKEQYDLAWSTAVRDELACLLWCEFKGECDLSFDSIWTVYLGAADASPPAGNTLSDWLEWLFLLPFTASLSTVAAISLLGLLAIRYGGSFGQFSLGIRSLATVIALSADDTSSDWSILCDACPTLWEWIYADDVCVYNLPSGYTLDIDSGQCGDGPGGFDGLYHYTSEAPATLIVRITPDTDTVINMRLRAGGNTTGYTIRDIQVEQGAFDETRDLGAGFSDYHFATGESGEITITLRMSGGSFNGVGITEIEIIV